MRNNNSNWLLELFDFCGITTCLMEELYVILYGCHIAYNVPLISQNFELRSQD
jgi:hypothetical protein